MMVQFLKCEITCSIIQRILLTSVSALTLFPRGFDQVIPQVLAVFLFYLSLVFPVGTTREGLLFGR
jgi:hypothetical protein